MGKCKICTHEKLAEIDLALVSGRPLRDIARQFAVSKDGLFRHKAEHLPASLIKSEEAKEITKADNLLERVRALQVKALSILEQSEAGGDLRTALLAIREARGNLELLAKMLGELQVQPTYPVFVTSPEWVALRTTILKALGPFPEARLALSAALDGSGA